MSGLGHKIVCKMMVVEIGVRELSEGRVNEDNTRFGGERIHVLGRVVVIIEGRVIARVYDNTREHSGGGFGLEILLTVLVLRLRRGS